jgi:methionine synthase II (cobalamin-independent)
MTIVDTIADEHYQDRPRLAMEFARIINAEARELVEAGLDVLQLATERVETPEEGAALLEHALQYVPADRLYPCTNCGMVPMQRSTARAKLHALSAGAHLVRARRLSPAS